MLFDFRTRLQAQTDPLPVINENAAPARAAETREGMELNETDTTTNAAPTQPLDVSALRCHICGKLGCEGQCALHIPCAITPELRTLIPSELAEVEYWTRVCAQNDAALSNVEPATVDAYADIATALALSRVFSYAVTLPANQHARLFWTYCAEVALAKLRRMA